MIYIFTALLAEARPFIDFFSLKKDKLNKRFQSYMDEKEKLTLVITGVGQINMAMAVAHTFSHYGEKDTDFAVNLGSCAGRNSGTFYINKITEEVTGKTFYPDIIYKHPFVESEIYSGMAIKNDNKNGYALYDMEAAAFYQSAVKYLSTDRISIIKAVSDNFSGEQVTLEDILKVMDDKELIKYIEGLMIIQEELCNKQPDFDESFADRLAEDLHLSVTLKEQLLQLLKYLNLADIPYKSFISEYYEKERIPARDKKEGKLILDEFKKQFI